MSKLIIPRNYKPSLGIRDTERAIKIIKDTFENNLAHNLNLERISAPLMILPESGLNDNLNGVERPVSFTVKDANDCNVEIVHSLAKWKRLALKRYGFSAGQGLYTDMNAIRRDEPDMDNLHSIYVDQWDWEKVITKEQRNIEMLKQTVKDIVSALYKTAETVENEYKNIKKMEKHEVFFITSQELEDLYPNLTPKQREDKITEEKKVVFIMQIGDKLKGGYVHDGRAPDYDDWQLNGDIMFWYDLLGCAVELTSMGIRVDEKSLDYQLNANKCNDRRELNYHKMLLNGELPLTIGGGLGQSRICMLLLGKAHVGEVQVSIWPEQMTNDCLKNNIILL